MFTALQLEFVPTRQLRTFRFCMQSAAQGCLFSFPSNAVAHRDMPRWQSLISQCDTVPSGQAMVGYLIAAF
jgi:hypothetical protein